MKVTTRTRFYHISFRRCSGKRVRTQCGVLCSVCKAGISTGISLGEGSRPPHFKKNIVKTLNFDSRAVVIWGEIPWMGKDLPRVASMRVVLIVCFIYFILFISFYEQMRPETTTTYVFLPSPCWSFSVC